MGFVHRGSLTDEFEQALRDLKPGGVSPVIQTLYGFHIVRVASIRPPEQKALPEVAAGIQKDLTNKRCADTEAAWTARLRASATIVLTGAATGASREAAVRRAPMRIRAGYLTCVLAVLPVAAQAQTLSGSIEGSGGAGSSTSNGQAQKNNSFWQGYTIGFSAPLINPKLVKLDTEVSFRAGSLNFTEPDNDQKGSQKDLGFNWRVAVSGGEVPVYDHGLARQRGGIRHLSVI